MRTRLAFFLSIAAFLASLGVFLSVIAASGPARLAAAVGEGSSAACSTTPAAPATALATGISGSADLVTYDASQDAATLIAYVCIKSGDDTFLGVKHSGPLLNGIYDHNGNAVTADDPLACYQVGGIGTSVATVVRLQASAACKAISHIDVGYVDGEPSPSPVPSPSPSPSAAASPSPSPEASPSPSPSAEASPSPSPSPSPPVTPSATSGATGTATERAQGGETPSPTATATATSTATRYVGK